jgi:CHAT domain-containing protein
VAYEEAASETFFKSVVAPFRYVHLATHGVVDPNQPMFSYLALASSEEDDGLLTVREIFGLNVHASLVVLSACETALGALSSGDEIIGLSRAFLYAGSGDVIVSLWSVADEPTAILMTRFYQLLKEHSAVESLRLAQIEVKERFEIPYYWAPFQIIGAGY